MNYTKIVIYVQGYQQDAFEVYADENKEQTIAFCFTEKDARLFAGAQKLLSALKDCVDRFGEMDCGPEFDKAREIIAEVK